jgi:NAD(P)-dependent dehydrogenase (short-subunit alcohol dehydrogenase family)
MSADAELGSDTSPRTDPLDMTGRTVIVTGGTKGLGRVIAERFLARGADVVICARREPEQPVRSGRRIADFVACDVREPDQVAAVVASAVDQTGRIDVLVNNAGGAPPVQSATVSPRFNEKIVALNLLAPMTFAQAVHDQMQSQDEGGVIINIASVSGTRANPTGAAYGAAKAGLINLTETLAQEWGPKIRVIAPVVGMIVTEDAQLFYGDAEGIAAVGQTLALGRMGVPEEIADVVLFCASPLARWVSGCTIPVHGGGEAPGYLGASTGDVTEAIGS